MLDQNADRFYWMIGAVVIVGMLIAAGVIAFPDLFSKVIKKFTDKLATGLAHFPIDSFSLDSLMSFFL